MHRSVAAFIGVFLAIFAAMNFYVGLRTWQTLGVYLGLPGPVFGLLWAAVAAVPVAGRIRRVLARGVTSRFLALAGGYWIAVCYYAFFAWLAVDLLRLAAARPGVPPPYVWGLLAWSAVFLLLLYGTWNAGRPVIRRHRVAIGKAAGDLKSLNAVLVSDVHLGPIVDNRRLEALVHTLNGLEADVVFFAGDTIDENVAFFTAQGMPAILRRLKTKYGAFAVLGNHEYIGGQSKWAATALAASGLTVLRDGWVKVAGGVYIAGRDDRSRGRFAGRPRAPLAAVLAGIDPSLPVILLDHQPVGHDEARLQCVDLQLSGHTHRGQFFPNNLVTSRVFAVDWGYLRIESLQIIVSSGYGTWGPPIRIGSRPEVVHIAIDFAG